MRDNSKLDVFPCEKNENSELAHVTHNNDETIVYEVLIEAWQNADKKADKQWKSTIWTFLVDFLNAQEHSAKTTWLKLLRGWSATQNDKTIDSELLSSLDQQLLRQSIRIICWVFFMSTKPNTKQTFFVNKLFFFKTKEAQ